MTYKIILLQAMHHNIFIAITVLLIITHINAQICPASYFFNGQKCAPCKANCHCTVEDTCSSCLSGYTYDALFQNCLQCPIATSAVNIGCKECCYKVQGPAFVCSSCQSGLYVYHIGGQCLNLVGCTKITNQGSCLSCASKYYLSQGACLACHASCQTCTDASLCLTCNTGYFIGTNINYSLCQTCSTGCITCTSAIACSNCGSGYYLSTGSCLPCSSLCITCTSTICSACSSLSVLISNVCYLCTDVSKQGSVGCLTCEATTLRVICKSCNNGYYLDPALNQCFTCTSKFPNSALCTFTNVIQCANDNVASLASRYYLFNNVCVANTNLCKSLADATGKCESCYFQASQYYTLLSSGVCSICNVAGCLGYATNCQCTSCQNTYQYINNQCISCQSLHCHKCQTSVSACQQCAPSYGRLSNACSSCQPANCYNCDGDNTMCSVCDIGYYRSSGNCYRCQTNCVQCLSKTVCTSCLTGTYLQSNGRCKTLPANCIQIDVTSLSSNVGKCKRCSYGYMLFESNCYPCSSSLFNLQLCLNNFCPNYYALLTYQWHAYLSFILLSLLIILY